MKKVPTGFPEESKKSKRENLKEIRIELKQAIKEYIKEEHMTMEQFARDKIFISGRQLRNYINGEKIPEQSEKILCRVLGKSREELLGYSFSKIKNKKIKEYIERYKSVFDLLDDIGINFHFEGDQLYMNPTNSEPIPFDPDLHDFFIRNIRKHAKDLYYDYYNSVHAFNYRYRRVFGNDNVRDGESSNTEGSADNRLKGGDARD